LFAYLQQLRRHGNGGEHLAGRKEVQQHCPFMSGALNFFRVGHFQRWV